ncbi:DUF6479 family protein [Streptomyces omiyaensis]|uniref:DUF6479 family protein n=1 Tax=Streptomyces omiyaensis TaxID=68247 RepID=A0ABW7BW00_9ACTN|nr:DUF6479 family protein [Streptomyces omiyaensis]GGY44023.1 hypothetical protein GCM10010363_26140 [Streptomyces omiyaensis]
MNTFSAENLAAGVWQSGLGQVIGGLVLVAILIGAFWFGYRVRTRESRPPEPEEQPHRPETGAIPGEMSEYRRPAEMPQTDGAHRLMPYQLKEGGGTETSPDPPSEEKRKWGGISSGGFGSGGTGHGD